MVHSLPEIRVSFATGLQPDNDKAMLAVSICQAASRLLSIPARIFVDFSVFQDTHEYGHVEFSFRTTTKSKGMILINHEITLKELIYPLTHELIHLDQIFNGNLQASRHGSFLWNGKVYPLSNDMTYEEYQNLPWEQDVLDRQSSLISSILTTTSI